MNKKYIGITGCITEEEVQSILNLFLKYGFTMESTYIPMIGILVSYKTLKFGSHPTKKERYPPIDKIPKLLRSMNNRCFVTLHFNSKTVKFSKEISSLLEQGDIYKKGLCRGIQLNIENPEHSEILKIKKKYPKLIIILQIKKSVLQDNISDVLVYLARYYKIVDYVLFDPSAGTGKEFDKQIKFSSNDFYMLYLWASQIMDLEVGFAGGFSPENISQKVIYLKQSLKTASFSLDVESGVRTNNQLDLGKVEQYISQIKKAFEE